MPASLFSNVQENLDSTFEFWERAKMTPDIPAGLQSMMDHQQTLILIGAIYYTVILLCAVFACIQLWLIREATKQTRDEILHARLILADHLKEADQSAGVKHKTGIEPLTD